MSSTVICPICMGNSSSVNGNEIDKNEGSIRKAIRNSFNKICFSCQVNIAGELWNANPSIRSLAREILSRNESLGPYLSPPSGEEWG